MTCTRSCQCTRGRRRPPTAPRRHSRADPRAPAADPHSSSKRKRGEMAVTANPASPGQRYSRSNGSVRRGRSMPNPGCGRTGAGSRHRAPAKPKEALRPARRARIDIATITRHIPTERHNIGMQLTHFGHSCLLASISDTTVLFDPGNFSHGFEGITGLSAILITHQHPDHADTAPAARADRRQPAGRAVRRPADRRPVG